MHESRLLQRLIDLRRTVRRRLILCGACALTAVGILGFLAIALVDWLLWLPPVPRVILGLAYLVGGGALLWQWLLRPARAAFGLNQIAAKLEEYNWRIGEGQTARLEDRLSSTVEFLLGNQAGSEQMRERVIANTDRIVERMHFRDALAAGPLAVRGLGLLAAVVVFGTVLWAAPGFVQTGLQRYVAPTSAIEWPREVQIVPLTGDMLVAVGESATLRMRVIRGHDPGLRCVMHLRSSDGQRSTLTMRREGESEYTTTISAITEDLSYWFKAGDDSTADRPLHIRVVPRPTVVEALATVHPPPYALYATPVLSDLTGGDLSAVAGSRLRVSIRSNKPVRAEADGTADASLECTDDSRHPLRFADAGGQALEAEFDLIADTQFRARLVDTDGFENRTGRVYRIRALADQPPNVVLVEPRSVTEVTPDGSVSLLIRADDGFGITDLRLVGRNLDTEEPFELPFTDRMTVSRAGDRVLALVEQVWEIAPLQLKPGVALVYQAQATDNLPPAAGAADSSAAGGPQIGRSAQLRLKIISQADFENRLRDELTLLQARIRQAMLDQQALNDQTRALGATTEPQAPPADAQLEAAAGQGARQVRLANRVRDLAGRFDRLRQRMALNNVRDAQQQEQVQRISDTLSQTASGPMSSAARGLGDAGQRDTADRAILLTQADADQRTAMDALGQIIRLMDQWGDFQEVVTKTRDLLDRQQRVRSTTADLGRRTLGQLPDALAEADQAELRRTQRKQDQLSGEADGLLNRLEQLADGIRAKDPAGADALEQALRAARAAELVQRMRDAAGAVGSNRTTAAMIEQRAAENGLSDMLAGLHERQQRQLAELAKRIETAERAVGELLRQQRELLEANLEAQRLESQADVYVKQAGQQRSLKRNTQRLADDLADMRGASAGGRLVRQAAAPMGLAEDALDGGDGARADDHQAEAIDLLAQAALKLEQLAEKTAHQAMQRSLAALRAKLEGIRNQQQDINDRTSEVIDRITAGERLGRLEYRRVARLAGQQHDLRPPVEEVRDKLGDAAVYRWVISRVLELIDAAGDALRARRLDDALADRQQDIMDELDLLIGALAEAADLPSPDEYAEGPAGGGGGGQGQVSDESPIPDVAELLVLKAMQLDLNKRTATLGDDFEPDTVTEAQLRQVQRLASRQEQIRELTQTVTQRANGRK